MTVHRDKILVKKPTEALNSNFIDIMTTCFGQPFRPSSGVLSRTSALVHFMEHPAPGSKQSSNCIKCTDADVRLRTPDDGRKGRLKHVES